MNDTTIELLASLKCVSCRDISDSPIKVFYRRPVKAVARNLSGVIEAVLLCGARRVDTHILHIFNNLAWNIT